LDYDSITVINRWQGTLSYLSLSYPKPVERITEKLYTIQSIKALLKIHLGKFTVNLVNIFKLVDVKRLQELDATP
jgi:hypothetical protein